MLVIIMLILKVISGVCKVYNDLAEAILNTQKIVQNQRIAGRADLETRKLSAEVSKLEAENPELQHSLADKREEITKSGIIIVRADAEGQDFDPRKWL